MLFVKVPKEIKEYEEKIIGGLTLRNIVWGSLGVVLAVVSYYPLRKIVGQEIASYLIMLIVVPCFSCGFLKVQGMPFHKYLKIMISYYSKSQILKYENTDGWISNFDNRKEDENDTRKTKKARKKELKYLKENQE